MAKHLVRDKSGKLDIGSFKIQDPDQGMVTVKNTYASLDRYDFECLTGKITFSKSTEVFGLCSVGVVEKIGFSVSLFSIGDRVLYFSHNFGAYSDVMNVDQSFLVKIPKWVSDEVACSSFLKIITSQYLVSRVYDVRKNSRVVVVGLSGGMGTILAQVAKSRGAHVIGFTRSSDLVDQKTLGLCTEVIKYKNKSLIEKLMKSTYYRGANVLYDPIGKDASKLPLFALGRLGTYVNFGRVTGMVDDVSVSLMHRKSLTFVSPSYHCYIDSRSVFLINAANAFMSIRDGIVNIPSRSVVQFDNITNYLKNAEKETRFGFKVIKF